MARESYVYDHATRELVPKAEFYARQPAPKISHLPCPAFISDSLNGVRGLRNMADGKIYDSKSEYYKAVRRAGCEVTGNEKLTRPATKNETPGGLKDDIRRAISELS